MKPVKHIKLKKAMKVSDLVSQMNKIGFGAGKIGWAADIMTQMIKDKDCKVFFGLAGAMVPGGMKEIVLDVLDNVDVFVTTGANMTHDLIEALGYKHLKGSAEVSDAELHKKEIDRIYDVFMPNKVYEGMEEFFKKHFDEFSKIEDITEFLWLIGSKLKKGILHKCWKKKIPIFCPAISDSGIGLMMWGHLAQGKEVKLKAFEDMKRILDIAWTCKKSGVIYLGGGVPKNYIQQAMQFTKGASYGVQITIDYPSAGGSSGAELREGISWGKMRERGNFVDLICDSTIAFPLIYSAVKDKL